MSTIPSGSFVTNILASAGRLDKDDLNTKIGHLSRKVSEVKCEVNESLVKRYVDFYPMFDETSALSLRVTQVEDEMKQMSTTIEKQIKAQSSVSAKDCESLFVKYNESEAALSILKRLIRVHEGFQAVDQAAVARDYVRATETLNDLNQLLAELTSQHGNRLKVLAGLQKNRDRERHHLETLLRDSWNETIRWIFTEPEKEETKPVLKVEIIIRKDSEAGLVQALCNIDLLDAHLNAICEKLMRYVVEPIVRNSESEVEYKQSMDSETLTVIIPVSNADVGRNRRTAKEVLMHLKQVLHFFWSHLLNRRVIRAKLTENSGEAESNCSLMQLCGVRCRERLFNTIIDDCLAFAVPTNHKDLPKFDEVRSETEIFRTDLVAMEFIGTDDATVTSYVGNVNLLFASKKCQEILERARSLLMCDIHNVVKIEDGACSAKSVLNLDGASSKKMKLGSDKAGVGTDDRKLDSLLKFPICHISAGVQQLVKSAYEIMHEAATSTDMTPPCAFQLFYAVRSMFELFISIVPVHHRDRLEKLPQAAAIHHNDCMYMAHHLMLICHEYKTKLPEPLSSGAATFVDLIPETRRLGTKSFLNQMTLQKKQLLECLASAQGFVGLSEQNNFVTAERAIKQMLLQLRHLEKVWREVLPSNVFSKAIGMLLNTVVVETLDCIIALEDISEDDARYLNSLLAVLSEGGLALLGVSPTTSVLVQKTVPKWNKLSEMMFVLRARLQDLVERWADSKGPLAVEFTAAEIKKLIRALFQNTDKRAAVLSSIK